MGHERFLLGYDVRPARNPWVPGLLSLLGNGPFVEMYSVDDALWPSLWERELRDCPRPAFVGPTQHLWMNLGQLDEETRRHTVSVPVMGLAVEAVVPDTDTMLDTWRARAEPVTPSATQPGWSILGVDVADYYLRSWMRLAAKDETWRARVQVPVASLNQSGLFRAECLAEALTLVSAANEHDPDDSGWCAFVLWGLAPASEEPRQS